MMCSMRSVFSTFKSSTLLVLPFGMSRRATRLSHQLRRSVSQYGYPGDSAIPQLRRAFQLIHPIHPLQGHAFLPSHTCLPACSPPLCCSNFVFSAFVTVVSFLVSYLLSMLFRSPNVRQRYPDINTHLYLRSSVRDQRRAQRCAHLAPMLSRQASRI